MEIIYQPLGYGPVSLLPVNQAQQSKVITDEAVKRRRAELRADEGRIKAIGLYLGRPPLAAIFQAGEKRVPRASFAGQSALLSSEEVGK
ncbi:hypothetical protein PAAG_12378 [Paracoccidioides lutzii Pb01]|uniref:Uncharacterized protein n=1 Tax=Paracoccidioides lutzii (strain ATCC MYA-826 / Pb01) TaxID=502779 RepID=A0A0A2UZD9_PARBA|nr:hypothetical protein PAAG_12378 [Paracoccidioides lutzii Pb01]KGQ00951.1 hypothetical protein PAAG_12378 [Paracoccidioides lutzii Pb01]